MVALKSTRQTLLGCVVDVHTCRQTHTHTHTFTAGDYFVEVKNGEERREEALIYNVKKTQLNSPLAPVLQAKVRGIFVYAQSRAALLCHFDP